MNDSTIKTCIIKEVCGYLNVSEYDLKTPCRKRELVDARHFIYYFLKRYSRLSLAEIGLIFRQSHSNVIHAINDMEDLIQYNGYAAKAAAIRKRIRNVIRTGTGAKRRSYHYKAMRRRSSCLFRIKIN